MADYGALRIIVTADTNTLGRQVISDSEAIGDQAGKTIGQGISGGISKAGSAISGAFKSIAGVAANTLGGAAIAATGFGAASIGASLRVDELNLAMAAVAKGTGKSLPQMQSATKGIAKQGVAYADAQKLVIDFSRANLDLGDAQKVATAAQDLAVLSGKSSSDTTAILTEAIIKQSPQLLEAAGVTTSLGQAQTAYSKKTGIAVSAMTVADKQQALLNEVLRQGGQVAGSYQSSMTNAGKVLRSFPRVVNDIAVSVGSRLTPAITPLVLNAYEMAKSFSASVKPGGALAPVIDAIGAALSKLAAPLSAAMKQFQGWFENLKPGQFAGIAAGIQNMAGPIAAVAAGLATFAGGNVLKNIPILGQMFGNLGGPIGALVVGIGTLVATSPDLRAAFMEILGTLKPLLPILMEVGRTIGGVLQEAMRALAPVVASVGKTLAGGLVAAITALAPALPPLAVAFGAVLQALIPILPPLAELIVLLVNSAIVPVVLQLASALATLATNFPGATAGVIGLVVAFGPLKAGIGAAIGSLGTFGGVLGKVAGSGLLDKAKGLDGIRLKAMYFGESLQNLGPTISKAFAAIGVAVKGFSATLLASPITWIVLGVVALGAALVVLYKKWEPFRNLVNTVWASMVGVGKAIAQGVITAVKFLGELPGKAVAALASLGSAVGQAISSAFQTIVAGVRAGIAWVATAFQTLGGILSPVASIIGRIITIITFPLQGLIGIIRGIVNAVVGIFTGDFTKVKAALGQIFSGLLQLFLGFPALALAAIIKFGPMILSWITGVFANLKSAVLSGLVQVVTFFATLPSRAINAIISLAGMLASTGRAALTALVNAVKTGLSNAVTFFATLPGRAFSAISSLAGRIASSARSALSSMGTAISTGIGNAVKFFATLPSRAFSALSSLSSRVASAARSALSAMGTAITTGISNAVTFFAGLPGKAATALAQLPGKMKDVGKAAIEGIKSGAEAAWGSVSTFFSGLPGKMFSAVTGVASKFAEIGGQITSGIVSGVGDIAGQIWSKISGGLSGLLGKAKSALGIHSPSTLFRDEIGKPITQGVIVGIESQEKALVASLDHLAEIPDVVVPHSVASASQSGSAAIAAASSGMAYASAPTSENSALLRTLIRMLEAGTTVNIDGRPVATAMSAQTLYGVSSG